MLEINHHEYYAVVELSQLYMFVAEMSNDPMSAAE